MSVTLSLTENAQITAGSVSIQAAGAVFGISGAVFPQAAMFRYQFNSGILFGWPLEFTINISLVSGSETFFIVILADTDASVSLVNGVQSPTIVPAAYSSVFGTATSIELSRKTVTTSGNTTFTLDLDLLQPFISTSLYYSGGWNGSLLLWLCTASSNLGLTCQTPVLTAHHVADYANRDTGRSGAPIGSRVSRCPVTGFALSRSQMVIDGWRKIRVHPMAYDPPEPDDPIFVDYPDEDN